MLTKIKNAFLTKQFLLFLTVGLINVLNGIIMPYLLSNLMNANIAYILSFIPNLFISYILNSVFTFGERKLDINKCIKFYVSYIPNFLIQNIVFYIIYNLLSLPKFLAIILAAVLGLPVTFIILKVFAFSKRSTKDDING